MNRHHMLFSVSLSCSLALLMFAAPRARAAVLPSSPSWTSQMNQAHSLYGWMLGPAGDVNGDGYSDVIVGAKNFDNPRQGPGAPIGNGGRAWVFLGGATGLASTPNWTDGGRTDDDENGQFGNMATTAGDVNGDGFDDVLVGEPLWDAHVPDQHRGRAYLFLGSAAGVRADTAWVFAGPDSVDAAIGWGMGSLGDVNGDGYDDVVVSSYTQTVDEPAQGRVYVFYGSSSGLPAMPSWMIDGPRPGGTWFGISSNGVGDVNGDGYDDLMVGAPLYDGYIGKAWLYLGGPAGLSGAAAWSVDGSLTLGLTLGLFLGRAGDVNGDGYSDVVIGAPGVGTGLGGTANLFLGGPSGLTTAPVWQAVGDHPDATLGIGISTAGDINGDGYADILVGAPDWVLDFSPADGQPHRGHAYVYLGDASGVPQGPVWFVAGDDDSSSLGQFVATAGDVNGDGYSDVLIAAPGDNNGQSGEGQVYCYHGGAAAPAAAPDWLGEGNQVAAHFGGAVASAGDVNGDGINDLVVGVADFDSAGLVDQGRVLVYNGTAAGISSVPSWSALGGQAGARFGAAVAGAGDLNGDGYADLAVGAPGYSNGQVGEGKALVYYGSATGLGNAPVWTKEGNLAGAALGSAVAGAGDVNGDGRADLLVGAPGFANGQAGEGRALLFTGSTNFVLGESPIWTAEGDAVGAAFGTALACAGDLNGDGYSDIVVGAPGVSGNAGQVRVYYGSRHGLADLPGATRSGFQPGERFGAAVAGAGDVDGNGASDLLVGAPDHGGAFVGEGRAALYAGSALGLSALPLWTATGGLALGLFGAAVTGLADVTGDGFCDIAVGAPDRDNGQLDEGRVVAFFGSPAGPSTTPGWIFESDQPGARLGAACTAGGDLNGDGFADLIVSAPSLAAGQAGEGRAFALLGNNGRGPSRGLRQRLLTNAPLAPLGRSDSPVGLRLAGVARTPAGRGRVRLEVEVKPLGASFDGALSGSTALVATGAPAPGVGSAAPLDLVVGGLTPGTPCRWRARLSSRSPFFPRSPWLSLGDNGFTEIDFRTAPGALSEVDDVETPGPAAGTLRLDPAFPNPTRTGAAIAFRLDDAVDGRVDVLDVLGRHVTTLAAGRLAAGAHRLAWDGLDADRRPVSTGAYFIRLSVGHASVTRKVVRIH